MKKGKNYFSSLMLMASICTATGCGSMTIHTKTDHAIKRKADKSNTLHTSTPCLFTGSVYDLCIPLGDQNSTAYDNSMLGFYLADFALAGALDTVALPYSYTLQRSDCDIQIAGVSFPACAANDTSYSNHYLLS